MLKKRLLTAIILIPLFILLVLKASPQTFYLFTALVVLWGAWEWSFFIEVKHYPHYLIYPLVISVVLLIAYLFPITSILHITLLWWLVAAYFVVRYPKSVAGWKQGVMVRGLMGFLVLVPCWLAVNFIRNTPHGISLLLFLFVLIWGADSGAYFSGKKWGKHTLIPQVSPGKTWEGLVGALLTTAVIAVAGLFVLKVRFTLWPAALLWALLTVLFSILGDLFESMMKRQAGLKDSGHLLPGHGGILDRIDSLTAAAPIFALGLQSLS